MNQKPGFGTGVLAWMLVMGMVAGVAGLAFHPDAGATWTIITAALFGGVAVLGVIAALAYSERRLAREEMEEARRRAGLGTRQGRRRTERATAQLLQGAKDPPIEVHMNGRRFLAFTEAHVAHDLTEPGRPVRVEDTELLDRVIEKATDKRQGRMH